MRIGAVDSGSARIGFVAAEGPAVPLRLLAPPTTIDVGRIVQLPSPETVTKRDGSTYVRTYRREVTPDDEREAAEKTVALIDAAGVQALVLEHVAALHFSEKAGPAGAAAAGTANLKAERIATRISVAAEARGIKVLLVQMASWRARVVGRARATDAEIVPAVAAGFVNWPEESTRDQRDAAGALLWSVLPAKAKPSARRGARKPRSGETRRVGKSASEALRLAKLAARVALACTCAAKHEIGCPLKCRHGYGEMVVHALKRDAECSGMSTDEWAATLHARRVAVAEVGPFVWLSMAPLRRDELAKLRSIDNGVDLTTRLQLVVTREISP